MNVSFVSQPWECVSPPNLGSVELITCATAERLSGSCQVTVFGRRRSKLPARERRGNILFRRVSVLHEDKLIAPFSRWFFRKPEAPLISSSWYCPSYIWQIARKIQKTGADIVHVHNFSQFLPVIRFLNPRVKLILHMHCEWLSEFERSAIEERLRCADAIIGCSGYITGLIQNRFPEFAKRCHTIYNSVDTARFGTVPGSSLDQTCNILFVGRVSPEKGLHVLVNAFRQVHSRMPNAMLHIIGPEWIAPLQPRLSNDSITRQLEPLFETSGYLARIKQSLNASLASKIVFRDYVSHSDLPAMFRNADLFVFPSVWHEPFGLPVAEAMAAGVAVVSTRSGGINEIVEDNSTGLLVERGDETQLAEAMIRLLTSKCLRHKMGENGRRRAGELFSLERNTQQLKELYQNLLSAA